MTISPLTLLKSGPPAPKAVLLSDAHFFIRAVPIAAGATAADVAVQVELALEALSPFPPAQLYHGYYWVTGAQRALVFAAYRRRFTTEQTAEWENAELVLPAFAALLGGDIRPGTTLVVPSADGVTGLYWDADPVPARVVFRPVPADAPEADRAATVAALREAVPTNRHIVLAAAPAAEASTSEREIVFRAEGFVSRLEAPIASSLDVRDKEALAALRRARARDLILWRTFVGCVALLLVLGLGELALVGLGLASQAREKQVAAQAPAVEKIETAQNLTQRINELSTKRLLPVEMLGVVAEKKPKEVTFLRSTTEGLYGLNVEAYATAPAAVSAFQAALAGVPSLASVEVRDQRTRDNVMNFTLAVVFKPETLKPAASTP